MIWSSAILIPLVEEAIKRIPIIGEASSLLIGIAWGIVVIIALGSILQKTKVSDIVFIFIVVLTVWLNLVINNRYTATFQDYWVKTLFTCIPCYFVGNSIDLRWVTDSKNEKYKAFLILTYLNIIAGIAFFFSYSSGLSSEYLYQSSSTDIRYTSYMFFAYALLPHMLFVGYDFILSKRVISLITTLCSFIVMLGQGTRGAILCVLVFVALVCFRRIRNAKLSVKLLIAVILMAWIVILINTNILNALAFGLQSKLYEAGLSTRTLDSFLQFEYVGDSGRSLLNTSFFESIWDLPLIGYGLMGDVALLGTYSHNIFIELIIEFGLLIGGIIAISIVAILIRAFKLLNDEKYYITCLFFCIGFVKLLVSGTYLTELWFFFLMGMCIRIYRDSQLTLEHGRRVVIWSKQI